MVYSDTTARKTFAASRETLLSFDRVSAVIHVTHIREEAGFPTRASYLSSPSW